MDNLLQNRLFLQYLSGAGGAMSSGKPVGGALNAITQQNIAAQSKAKLNERYMKLMKQMMEGEIPTKGKMTMDETGLKFDVPKSALATLKDDSVEGIAAGLKAEAPSPGPDFGQMSTNRSSYVNPSASPLDDISGADLAGLTAADVSQALSGAVGVQALKQKTLTDIANIANRKNVIEDMKKRTEIYGRPRFMPAKDERTTAVKNYEYARSLKGGATKKTFEEWEGEAKTTHQKHYAQAVEEGYKGSFHEWLRDMTALGGGLSLGEKVAEKEAMGKLKGKLWYTDPKGLPADVEKYKGSEDYQNYIMRQEEPERASIQAVSDYIEGRLTEGGTVESVRMEGRVRIWTVKWRDGSISEVKHAF